MVKMSDTYKVYSSKLNPSQIIKKMTINMEIPDVSSGKAFKDSCLGSRIAERNASI